MNLPILFSPATLARRRAVRGFTLVELMVSVTVLSLLLVLVFQMLDETQKTWSRAKGMVASFKDARNGFEAMNRNVSQATLNTYLGYDVVKASGGGEVPKSFQRKSELHFICGPAKELLGDTGADGKKRLTHCVFFQAPLGYQTFETHKGTATRKDSYGEMDNLLNGWGYFVEYASDRTERPQFLSTMTPPVAERYRFRLMEFRQPAEATTIYQYHLEQTASPNQAKLWEWFKGKDFGVSDPTNNDPLSAAGSIRTTRVLADNIIALVISPRLAENDTLTSADSSSAFRFKRSTDIAPEYLYDSRRFQYETRAGDMVTYSRHQVPPVLRVTIVAIDEVDAVRYAAQNPPKELPKYAPDDKFFQKVENFPDDMKFLTESLNAVNIRHRIFTSNIRMREGNFQKIR
jgi:uncharacterized protein (TIGR02599 family)